MKTVQTIDLSNDERETIEKALYLIDQIWKVTDVSLADIFEYFAETSDLTTDGHYSVKALHNIEEMKGTV